MTLVAIMAFVALERHSRVNGVIDWGKVAARAALVLALYATLVPIIFSVFSSAPNQPDTPTNTPQPSKTDNSASAIAAARQEAADRISACESVHGMPKANHIEYDSDAPSRFMHCEWPPSPLADADGYWEIRVSRTEGPGRDEASGTSLANRVNGPCERFLMTYDYGHMGDSRHLKPFKIRRGEIYVTDYDAGGVQWTGDRTTLPFYPTRAEAVILTSGHYLIADATCA
ncbi:hypothetical protein ACIBI9_62105 [Nonomuraea sp. NPDC050451]|uniref:hypothetical protein n=1 Tax=Nonomuraea sp. NPDC050451 TaxID=3364364 RepID=UPI0037A028AE